MTCYVFFSISYKNLIIYHFQNTTLWPNLNVISATPAVLKMASDLEPRSGRLLTDNSTILLVVGFVLGLVTVAIVVGFVQYYYCNRKNANRQSFSQSDFGWGTGNVYNSFSFMFKNYKMKSSRVFSRKHSRYASKICPYPSRQ